MSHDEGPMPTDDLIDGLPDDPSRCERGVYMDSEVPCVKCAEIERLRAKLREVDEAKCQLAEYAAQMMAERDQHARAIEVWQREAQSADARVAEMEAQLEHDRADVKEKPCPAQPRPLLTQAHGWTEADSPVPPAGPTKQP